MYCQHRGLNRLRVFKWEAMIFGQRKMVYSEHKTKRITAATIV